jgi:hypothetical protein
MATPKPLAKAVHPRHAQKDEHRDTGNLQRRNPPGLLQYLAQTGQDRFGKKGQGDVERRLVDHPVEKDEDLQEQEVHH